MYMFQSFDRLVDLQRVKNVKVDPMSVKVGHPCPKPKDKTLNQSRHHGIALLGLPPEESFKPPQTEI